jgi:hypothetical protein
VTGATVPATCELLSCCNAQLRFMARRRNELVNCHGSGTLGPFHAASTLPWFPISSVIAALDPAGFTAYYETQHAAVLKRFPGIRSLVLHAPTAGHDLFPVKPGGSLLLAQMTFNSAQALDAALCSAAPGGARGFPPLSTVRRRGHPRSNDGKGGVLNGDGECPQVTSEEDEPAFVPAARKYEMAGAVRTREHLLKW